MATEYVCECRDITDVKDKEKKKKTIWNVYEHLETRRGFVRSSTTELGTAQECSRAKEHKTKVGQVKGNGNGNYCSLSQEPALNQTLLSVKLQHHKI